MRSNKSGKEVKLLEKKQDILVLTCKRCGKDFLYEYRAGRKPDYCTECRAIVDRQQHYDYLSRIRNQGTIEEAPKAQVSVPNDITKDIVKNIEDEKYKEFIERISTLLSDLDTLRVKMCELSTEMNNYQSSFDKNDQSYLHKLENVDTNNEQETLQMIRGWQNSRIGRRGVKDLQNLLGNVISAIPYKNYTNALPVLKASAFYKR